MSTGMGTMTFQLPGANVTVGDVVLPSVGQNVYDDDPTVTDLLTTIYPGGSMVLTSGWPVAPVPAPGGLITSAAGTTPPAQPLPFTTRVQP